LAIAEIHRRGRGISEARSTSTPSGVDRTVANLDALIARTNVDRPRVDVAYVAGLSDNAIPALLEALPSLRPDLRQALVVELLRRRETRDDWRSFNFARSRATSLLEARHDELLEL
jgi:DNA helicase HerA-like ATPase